MCEKSFSVALKILDDVQPDYFTQLGDWLDLPQISDHKVKSLEGIISLDKEIDIVNNQIDQVERCLPDHCKKMYLEGNHERRLRVFYLNHWNSRIAGILGRDRLGSFDEELFLKERGWSFLPYNATYITGDLARKHGKFVSQYHAAKNATKGNTAFMNCVYGHTHTYQSHTVIGRNGESVIARSIGTLSKFNECYLDNETPNWVNMICAVDYYDSRSFITPIEIKDGMAFYGGKMYGAD